MEALQTFFTSFRIASPFLALGAAVIFFVLLFVALRRRKPENHSHLEFLPKIKISERIWHKLFFIPHILLIISVLLALANPQVVKEVEKPLEARDIIIVLDTSGSMMVGFYPEDLLPSFEKTGLGVAWRFLREFVAMRNGDRMAVILYDDPRGYVARGFTDDQEQLLSIFNKGEIEGVYESSSSDTFDRYAIHRGTNTPSALELAEDYFEKESKAKTKLIILVTDLDDDSSEVPFALAKTREKGIRVYTIGIVKDAFSGRIERLKNHFKDEGLRFFAVQDKEGIASALKSIDQMEKSVVEIKEAQVLHSLSWAFVIAAIFFSIVLILFCEKFKKVP